MQNLSLEDDLKKCNWILDKLKNSESYAQNLYAAFCNVEWQKVNTQAALQEESWFISWRSSGGLIAELRDVGEDYMDFYCSGIFNSEDKEIMPHLEQYVSEGTVTEEVKHDLAQLGWVVSKEHNK